MKKQVAAALQPKPSRATQAHAKLSLHEIKDMKAMNVLQPGDVKNGRPEHKFQKKPQKHAKVPGRVLAKAGFSPYGSCDVEV
jgi:sialic acid synthase SpsE